MLFCASSLSQPATQMTRDQKTIWGLEQAYWQYCKEMNLEKYRSLWHPSVLGWPKTNSAPVGKDHISDWLTEPAKQGVTIKPYDLERLAINVTDNVAVVHYRVKYSWIDKEGKETPGSSRITHTWLRSRGGWQIIGGMSAPTDAQGR